MIELRTGKILGAINADTAWDRMPRGGILPARWSADSSLLVWEVEGKWFPMALVLLKLSKGKVDWQTNILEQAQRAILGLTKIAAPEKYAEAKEANTPHGAAYPDGFSIDVEVIDPVRAYP